MAIEVYKSTVAGSDYSYFPDEVWGLGNFFSSCANINIIDSYTSHWWSNYPHNGAGGDPPASYVAHRYKGDPFADTEARTTGTVVPVWYSKADIGAVNDWIVIECQCELPELAALGYSLPKWQCKLQWQSSSSGFADVSDPTGVLYPVNHGSGREMFWRFAPWGGWDLATSAPDFDLSHAANPTSENRKVDVGSFGSAGYPRDYVVVGDGWLARWSRWHGAWSGTGGYGPGALACVIGDVLPVDPVYMPMPRAMLANGGAYAEMTKLGNGQWLCVNGYYSYSGDYTVNDGFAMTFWDNSLARIQQGWINPGPGYGVMEDGLGQPHPYSPDFELDMMPYIPVPYHRGGMVFSVPSLRQGYGTGFHPINNRQWMSFNARGPSIFVRWDGVSDLW